MAGVIGRINREVRVLSRTAAGAAGDDALVDLSTGAGYIYKIHSITFGFNTFTVADFAKIPLSQVGIRMGARPQDYLAPGQEESLFQFWIASWGSENKHIVFPRPLEVPSGKAAFAVLFVPTSSGAAYTATVFGSLMVQATVETDKDAQTGTMNI